MLNVNKCGNFGVLRKRCKLVEHLFAVVLQRNDQLVYELRFLVLELDSFQQVQVPAIVC